MRRIGNRFITPLFGLLVAASLTFGVTSTRAQARNASECFYSPTHALGYCATQQECQTRCEQEGGRVGECTSFGCCMCAS